MTIQEVSEKYKIPIEILQDYESWGLCGAGEMAMDSWRCDDGALERLSTIMTLHEIGFTSGEIEAYMRLLRKGSAAEQVEMLNNKRAGTLAEIHLKEKQLDRLDYLRFEIQKKSQRSF